MRNQKNDPELGLKKRVKRLSGWVRLTGVLFRVLIGVGLILLILVVIALVSRMLFSPWILLVPSGLIILGILLAWLEYRLDGKLYALSYQQMDKNEESGGENDS